MPALLNLTQLTCTEGIWHESYKYLRPDFRVYLGRQSGIHYELEQGAGRGVSRSKLVVKRWNEWNQRIPKDGGSQSGISKWPNLDIRRHRIMDTWPLSS